MICLAEQVKQQPKFEITVFQAHHAAICNF